MSGALASVVASTATHSSPRSRLMQTRLMVARNSSRQPMKTRLRLVGEKKALLGVAHGAARFAAEIPDGVDGHGGEQDAGDAPGTAGPARPGRSMRRARWPADE